MARTANEILQRYEQSKGFRSTWEDTWQQICDNILGRKDFITRRTAGEIRGQRIYDTTAAQAKEMLAAHLDSLLTNSATRWGKVVPSDPRVLEDQAAAEWFRIVEDKIYSMINRPAARFTSVMHEFYSDLCSFGTAAMYVEDVPEGVTFHSRPLQEMYLIEDHDGDINSFFRSYDLTALQTEERFPGKVGKARKMVEDGNGFELLEFVQYVRENPNFREGTTFGESSFRYVSTHVSCEEKRIVAEGGFRDRAFMFGRFSKDPGEIYGRGPGVAVLPVAKMLNEMMRTILVGAQKQTEPPLMAEEESIIGKFGATPASLTIVRPTGFMNPPIQEFGNKQRIDIGVELVESQRRAVQNTFMAQLLELFQDPRMTATGVVKASDAQTRTLSPFLGRYQTEFLAPIHHRIYNIASRRGMFPEPPPSLEGTEWEIRFQGPIARAQQQGEVNAMVDALTVVSNLADVDPSILDNIDFDAAWQQISSSAQLHPSISRDSRQVEEIRQMRAQQQQQEQQRAQLLETIDTVGNLPQQGEAAP